MQAVAEERQESVTYLPILRAWGGAGGILTADVFEMFRERLLAGPAGPAPRAEVICDRDIPGPWDRYATVWRFVLRPPSDGYLRGGESYFFL